MFVQKYSVAISSRIILRDLGTKLFEKYPEKSIKTMTLHKFARMLDTGVLDWDIIFI